MSKEKDNTEQSLLTCNDVFADIVNVFLCHGETVVEQQDLTDSAPTSQFKADGKIHEQERDVAKFWSQAGIRIAILGIENQTRPDPDMPLRVIGYDGASYKEQVLQHDAAKRDTTSTLKPLPPYPAITLVINYGKTPWNKPKSLLECIGENRIPESLRPYFNDYKIHVFDIATLSRDELKMFTSDFQHVVNVIWAEHNNVPYEPSGKKLVHADKTLKALANLTRSNKFLEAYDNIPQEEKEGGIDMCRVVNEIEKRGIELGEKRGIEFGVDIAAGVVRSFKDNGGSVPKTAKENNLSEEETISILKKFSFPV